MLRNECALPLPSKYFLRNIHKYSTYQMQAGGQHAPKRTCAAAAASQKNIFSCNMHKYSTYQMQAGGQHAPKRMCAAAVTAAEPSKSI